MDKQVLEDTVVRAVRTILDENQSALDQIGLRAEVLPVRRTTTPYTSELAVCFWWKNKKADIQDILEFFIFRNNEPAASFDEICQWFRTSLADVLQQSGWNPE